MPQARAKTKRKVVTSVDNFMTNPLQRARVARLLIARAHNEVPIAAVIVAFPVLASRSGSQAAPGADRAIPAVLGPGRSAERKGAQDSNKTDRIEARVGCRF